MLSRPHCFGPAISGAVALVLVLAMALPASAAAEPYGLESFSNRTVDADGAPYALAGGHADQNITDFSLTLFSGGTVPEEELGGTYVNPPLGFVGNPSAAPRCLIGNVRLNGFGNDDSDCPTGSQIGFATVTFNTNGTAANGVPSTKTDPRALYNLVPERGYPAQFAFQLINETPTVLSVFPRPRTEGYGLTVGTPTVPSAHVSTFGGTFCGYGVEGDGSDPDGPGPATISSPFKCKPSSALVGAPFLSNPVDCSESAPTWSIALDSVEHAGSMRAPGVPDLSDPDWKTDSDLAPPVTGCDDPALTQQFNPTIATKPLQAAAPVQADQPAGLRVALEFPQANDPTDPDVESDPSLPQAPPPKDITVELPAGLAISPASAGGLGACSDQASDPAGDQVHYDNTKPVACPDSAKIGSATAFSPLLATYDPVENTVNGAEPIPGDVYLLKPHHGDLIRGQDGKFRLLIELENSRYGVNFKLPGIATADKDTGQITTVFTENPQLPASHLTVDLKEGKRAPLMTPVTCGKYDTSATLVPWSTPGTPDAHSSASFDVGSGPNGSACPASEAARPFAPALSAGTESNRAGSSAPFTLKLTRPDGDQELSSLNVTTPPGFTAKLKGIPSCSEAAIAAAKGKSGGEEQANPSCPAASQVGTTTTGAGPGTNPLYTPGKAYLAGPYKGAPLSFAFITPAVAGPFDLGNVVIRAGAYLDPATAQVTVKTDELPQILDGVPLRLRSITTRLDRSDFTLNPTDCEPMQVSAQVNGSNGATANPSAYFQVGGCKQLGFKPKLRLALKGRVSRRAHPSLRAHLTARPGDANIAFAQVKLPKAAFLDNAHISGICSRVQFAADQCPKGSIYGYASATTPLLDYTLTGNVYLRANPAHKLPDLVVGFNGPSSQPIEIELAGKTDSVNGALRNTFEAVPDVPVTDFRLTLFGGKKGLIEMSSGFCKSPRATYKLTGQNGKTYNTKPKVAAKCPKGKGKKKPGEGKGKKRTGGAAESSSSRAAASGASGFGL